MKQIELKHSLLSDECLKILKKNGITTVEAFLNTVKDLPSLTKLSKAEISIVRSFFKTMYDPYLPVTLSQYSEILEDRCIKNKKFLTGIKSLDKLLNGLTLGSIIELCGNSLTGKTLLCNTIAMNLLEKYEMRCYWIDTKMDFNSIRAYKVMRSRIEGKTMIDSMKMVYISRVFKISTIIDELEYLIENAESGLLIIDCLSTLMFDCTRSSKLVGHYTMKKIMDYIRTLCTKKNFTAILVVLPKIGTSTQESNNSTLSTQPSCNNRIEELLNEYCSERILLTRTEPDEKKFENLHVRNCNERHLYLMKHHFNIKTTVTPSKIFLTDEGVV